MAEGGDGGSSSPSQRMNSEDTFMTLLPELVSGDDTHMTNVFADVPRALCLYGEDLLTRESDLVEGFCTLLQAASER